MCVCHVSMVHICPSSFCDNTLTSSHSPDHFKVEEWKVDSSRELDLNVDNGNEVPVRISVEKHGIYLDVGSSKSEWEE